jgi:hypothetical protein
MKKPIAVLALTTLVAFLVPAVPSSGQVLPAPPPLAASENVEVLGNIPGSFFGMNFRGDYAFATGATG